MMFGKLNCFEINFYRYKKSCIVAAFFIGLKVFSETFNFRRLPLIPRHSQEGQGHDLGDHRILEQCHKKTKRMVAQA